MICSIYALGPKGLNKSNIGGNAGPNFLLLRWGTRYTELFTPNMIHSQYLVAIFPILYIWIVPVLLHAYMYVDNIHVHADSWQLSFKYV